MINASAPTSTYYRTNEMYLTGTLMYVGSDYGDPVNNLNGTLHQIYLSAEAERTLGRDPYLTNLSSADAVGYLDIGYKCKIPYGDMLYVYQTLYNGNYTRDGWAYYEVIVDDIQTNLLYRPDRNDRYITILCAGGIMFSLVTVFKVVRHD